MRLLLEFEPCGECAELMRSAGAPGARERFLRHITYNHPELAGSLAREAPGRAGPAPGLG